MVIGVLVDDAIVEIENIAQHRAMGKTRSRRRIDATDEIGIAVIATSVTLAAVFVPVAFMPGEVGLFFREFGWTAATAVLCLAAGRAPADARCWPPATSATVERAHDRATLDAALPDAGSRPRFATVAAR